MVCTPESVYSWLAAKNVMVPKEWIKDCLTWLFEEYSYLLYDDEIKKMVYEQWTYSDLRQLNIPVIPIEMINSEKYTYQGQKLLLQVMWVADFEQTCPPLENALTHSKNSSGPDSLQTPFSQKRKLLMELTDGVNYIKALNVKPFSNISIEKIIPGMKVGIHNPVLCRNGIMILKESNIELIGGEVEELVNLSKNQDCSTKNGSNTIVSNSSNVSNSSVDQYLAIAAGHQSSTDSLYRNQTEVSLSTDLPAGICNEDIILFTNNLSRDFMSDVSDQNVVGKANDFGKRLSGPPEKKSKFDFGNEVRPNPNKPYPASEYDNQNVLKKNMQLRPDASELLMHSACDLSSHDKSNETAVLSTGNQYELTNIDSSLKSKNSSFNAHSDDDIPDDYPFVYIRDFAQLIMEPDHTDRIYHVRGFVCSIVSPLKFNELENPSSGEWYLKIRICDGTSMLDCLVDSALIDEWIMIPKHQILEIKQQPQKLHILTERLPHIQRHLSQLSGIFHLFCSHLRMPQLINYQEVTVHQLDALELRVNLLSKDQNTSKI